jgi:hypothetical protein
MANFAKALIRLAAQQLGAGMASHMAAGITVSLRYALDKGLT